MSLILKQETPSSVPTPAAGKGTIFLNNSDQVAVKDSSGNVSTFPTISPTGNTQVFYNDAGSLTGSNAFVFNNTSNTVTIENLTVTDTLIAGDIAVSSIANGTSNVDIVGVSGNVTTSVGGNANIFVVTGTGANVNGTLNVSGNTLIQGNLTVDGNVVYVNVESLSVEDPLISLGGGANGAPLTSNNGYDRGLILHNYTSQAVDAFMGWDTSNGEFAFASNASVASDVVTINALGNIRANNIAGTLSTAAQPNITSVGTLTSLLVGSTASQADFPNAKVILSQDNSGQTHSENIGVVGEAVADSGNTSTWGIGVLGEARANGATKATGVQGGGYVTNSTDSGAAVGVRGYSIQTHSGGYNIGVLGNAAGSGLGNYAFYVQAGDVGSIETETNWDLYDDSQVALTFRSSGKANIFGIDTTDGAEGIYSEGYLNVTGNVAAGGVKTDNLYYANGSPWDLQEAAGSNTYVQYNLNGNFGANSQFTYDSATSTLSAPNIAGTLTTAAQPNITSVGSLTGLTVSGNTSINANLYVQYALNTSGAIYASGNIESNANIGAVGNITGGNLSVTGNVVANIVTANSTSITGNLSVGNISASGQISATGNIGGGNLSALGIVTAVGNVNAGNVVTGGKVVASGNINTLGNVIAETHVFIGNNATNITLLSPILIGSASGEQYIQAAMVNQNANGSADYSAYGDNGNSDAGWADMGFTGSTFNDANYTITKPNDGYFFVQSVNGAGLGGNLVLATGDQGANNDIVFATGGFLAANEKMRLISAQNQLNVQMTTPATNTTTGAVVVAGGVGIAGNLYTGALINAVGNINGANLTTGGVLSVTGNANVGNLGTSGLVVATGNVTGGNLVTGGVVSATGNVTGGNLVTGGVVSATGNVTGGNLVTGGVVSATGNVTGGNLNTSGNVNASIIVDGGTGIYLAAGPSGYINFFTTGGDKATITDTGNIAASNLIANSTVFATTANVSGNVNAGNIITGGVVSATGNVSGGNLTTGGVVSATGNVTGGNLTTGGLVSATGNIVSSANVVTDLIVGKTSSVTITATGTNQNINLVPTGTGTVNVGNFIISNVQTPVNDFDAATKKYVDDVAQGLHTHDACQAATPDTLANITSGTITYNNGASGVGANLVTTGSFNLIDGVNVQTGGTRILVKNEANTAHNGIYVWSNATVITRADDFNTPTEMAGGDFTFVQAGTLYDNTGWVMPDPVPTVGTSPVVWTQFSGAGTYTAGTGLTLSGSQFSITNTTVSAGSYGNGDYNATFTVNGQGQLTAAANVALTPNAANLSGTTLKSTVVNSSLTSVGTLVTLSVSGNANVGNVGAAAGVFTTVAGNLTTAAQPNITSVGTLTSLGVNGTVTAVAFTANTGVFTGNGSGLSAIAGANVTGTVSSATTAGTVTTAAQGNITSVGTLTSLAVTGNISAGNVNAPTFGAHNGTVGATTATTGAFTTISATGQITSTLAAGTAPFVVTSTTQVANLNVATAGVAGTVSGSAQGNITSVGTLSSLSVSGNISAGNVTATYYGAATGLTGIPGANITGTIPSGVVPTLNQNTTGYAATVSTAAQPNITSVGTLTGLSMSGTINSSAATVLATTLSGTNSANLIYASMGDNDQFRILVGATATNAGYVEIATADDGTEPIYVRQYTGVFSSLARTATLLDGSGNTSFPGSVTAGGFVQTTSLTTGGSGTAGTITGNWSLGSGSKLNATYADLAEKYTSDADYEPGTVLVFGGDEEVTLSQVANTTRVAGVVTTNPAYTMNDECAGDHVATIALQGRVPCKVIGPVFKGDLLVAGVNGHAIVNNEARAGTIIGKSLQNFNGDSGVIEVAVGRF